MTPESYLAAARKLRKIAAHLDARCTPQTPHERASLTSTIHGLALFARQLSQRHRAVDEISQEDYE